MTTAVVFAGHSFVGRPICETLRRLGARVVVTARGAAGSVAGAGVFASPGSALAGASPTQPRPHTRDDPIPCDLTDPAAVDAVLAAWRPDWVVQCAGATRTTWPWPMYALHVQGTLGLLSAVARHTPRARVVLLGSAAEYGPVPPECLPVREDQTPRPVTAFAASKLAQTHLAAVFAHEHRLRVVTLRPFNVLGPGLPEHYFAAALARRLLVLGAAGPPGPVPIANLHATRDFVDVRDLAEAVALVLTRAEVVPGEMPIYNVAGGVETSLEAVAALLGRLAGSFVPCDGGDAASRGGVQRSRGDATRLRQATGWAARYTWQESVAELWAEVCRQAPSGLHGPAWGR
jgi:nucleoside-diphosphate-sugar epimerase